MKQKYFILGACITAGLAGAPGISFAQSTASMSSADFSDSEARRVIQTVTDNDFVTIRKTHPAVIAQATSSIPLADTATMNHLQLILKPSSARQAKMETLIANQHDPKSAQFRKWLTPKQFGSQFGVVDGDIAAVTAWLVAEGFTVNNAYPNKTQIDFTGTAGQVEKTFHTRENYYKFKDGSRHLANASDVAIPAALQPVVAGVVGLNDFHATAFHKKPEIVRWNASKRGFGPEPTSNLVSSKGSSQVIGQAISFNGGLVRGLAPNDMVTMYGIRTLRANGVTGKGITIAVVEDNDMVPSDWTNFVGTFNLGQFGGTFQQIQPAPASGTNNCLDPDVVNLPDSQFYDPDDGETLLDAEWSTAIAPGANIVVASCADNDANGNAESDNFFGGVFIASTNLINGNARPDIISASYGYGEYFVDAASKTAIDLMWAQADAEGISVFVSTGDSGSNPSFNGGVIVNVGGNSAVDANSFATSPHVTAVGGTDLADVLDGTTSKYFAPTPSIVGGSALSYVPEIPWNESCGNGVAAKAFGFGSAIAFCQAYLLQDHDPEGFYATSEAGSGGPSSVDAKPAWQRMVFDAAKDQSRDVPDVALFAGSYGNHTFVLTCTSAYPCVPGFSSPLELSGGTSLATPMFAGIQALIDQGLTRNGLPPDQGNAAPTLYALAAQEYGDAVGPAPASLSICNADNGATGTDSCVFHNVTRGSISTQCIQEPDTGLLAQSNCYYYGTAVNHVFGLTTSDAAPTSYSPSNKAFGAQPGWSFASGLGSVNVTNLLIAWRAFVNAPPAALP